VPNDARAVVVAEARRWIGTPYCHQASALGAGCDCLGLVRGVWRALHGAEPLPVPRYSADWVETAGGDMLWQALTRALRPAGPEPGAGDVVLFRLRERSAAKHLGIVTETGPGARFVHAYSGHGVVESPLSQPWRRRVVARFDMT